MIQAPLGEKRGHLGDTGSAVSSSATSTTSGGGSRSSRRARRCGRSRSWRPRSGTTWAGIVEWGANPDDYLLCRRDLRPNRHKPGEKFITEYRDQPMGVHGLHQWWYRCLQRAGIVAEGVTSGRKMHMARHTAGQSVLDSTGNLKAVQKLLGHSSITTTGDIYTDWDIDQLEETMRFVVGADDGDDL